MDLKELNAFQTILLEGTFSKAAAKLNYAQSTITNQIQRLEKELGIQLFKRGWDAELTSSGKLFALEVEKLIQHWNYVTEQAKALQAEEIGTLNIGSLEALAEHVLPNVLPRFREYKPRISCNFITGNTDYLSSAVLQHQLDFAVCGEPTDPSLYYFEPLYEERIVFIVKRDHPLMHKSIISFEGLLDYPLIVGGPTCLYYLRLAKQFSHYEQNPFLYTVTQISSIPMFVRQFDCVGVVLDSTPLPVGIVKIPVELKDSSIQIGMVQLRKEQYLSTARNLLMLLVKEELLLSSHPSAERTSFE
ncbi:LysR substrate-binding domain-containing protein [Paenibacillus agricola]|uniref:LysR family transcriptional regulator n=1 Tax=Paenibacillus agricola TaxID=2716264 RepID=A0ABX0J9H0_9BACL|nr:LysR family transcriptional regulator [Paenibacillus agricola]NHN31512.1 LysR family transcriptional regulator [Paenibacillus agricola]